MCYNINSAELFDYIYQENLILNDAYKKGNTRAGCLVCPMSSGKHEYLKAQCYPAEVDKLVEKIKSTTGKNFSEEELVRFVDDGNWKTRKTGRELGSIQPIKDLCKVAHDHGALFHTDAVQAAGHVAIDVNDLGVDMLSASAHKFNGAKGVGFLYVRTGTTLLPYADGGAQEHGLRAGTENVAGIVSMAVALKKNVNDLNKNQRHILELESILLQALNESGIPYVRNGGDHTLPGVISLSFDGKDGEAILHRMDLMGVCISTGSACDSKNTEISHVLQAVRMPENLAKGTIRISLGKNNTVDDIDTIVTALRKILL